MSEVASFGNIVNSLLSLRDNYHEQLKSVPQYEAYLLVASSTEKASHALNASAEQPSSIAAEVIDSLQFARSRFEQHLNSVPEYRTLLAIDKLIKEIAVDLGVLKPEQTRALEAPEPVIAEASIVEPAPAAEPAIAAAEPEAHEPEQEQHEQESAASAEPDPVVVTAQAIETEAIARPPIEAPVPPSRPTAIDIDEALSDDDDIVSVHVPRRETEIEGGEDDDLLEVTRRDVKAPASEKDEDDAVERHNDEAAA